MASRKELHVLVDSLPEQSLEPAAKMLTRLQTWPPVQNLPPELAIMRGGRPSVMQGFGGTAHYSPSTRAGSSSSTHWDGDTLVVDTRHYHLGHLLEVNQNIRLIEKNALIYKHQISGPGGKSGEHEIRLEIDA